MTATLVKRAAAAAAMAFVRPNMKLGLGTGSTAARFVDLLGAAGHDGPCVPTSEATRLQAERLGLTLATLDESRGSISPSTAPMNSTPRCD